EPMRVPSLLRSAALTVALGGGAAFGQTPPAPNVLPPEVPAAAPVASAVRRLTLDEARQLALANNKALALARLNVEEKRHATAAARKDYLPKFLGNVTYFHFDKNLGEVLTFERGKFGILQPGVSTFSVPIVNQNATMSTVLVAQPITKLIA